LDFCRISFKNETAMQYNFDTAIRIIFGPETIKDATSQKAAMGYLGLVTIGQSQEGNCLILKR
jgi:hypothetical protein